MNEQEIIALGKLLNFIKFDCSDEDCLLFAASPIISFCKKTPNQWHINNIMLKTFLNI